MAACNQTAGSVNGDNDNKGKETQNKSDLTLTEVFEKSGDAMNGLESYAAVMNMTQKMEMAGESMDIGSKTDMQYIVDPLTLHQKIEIDMGEENQIQAMEAYLTEDGFFMYEPSQDMWLKLPEEFVDQVLNLQEGQQNPADQLKQLETFIDDFKFTQDDSQYILTLKADGEKFNEFLKETMLSAMPEGLPLDDELFGNMTFNEVEYEIFIDKKSFYTTQLNMTMDMDTDVEGQTMKMKQKMNAVYSNFNGIDSIQVPEEALENAQDIDSFQNGE